MARVLISQKSIPRRCKYLRRRVISKGSCELLIHREYDSDEFEINVCIMFTKRKVLTALMV